MNWRYQGPAVFPPASQVRKQVEAHLDALVPPADRKATRQSAPVPKKWTSRSRRARRRP